MSVWESVKKSFEMGNVGWTKKVFSSHKNLGANQ